MEINFTDHNWELIQFKYEVLNYSLEDLAAEHSLSLPVLKFNAQSWKKLSLVKEKLTLQDVSSIEDILLRLGDQTANETKAFSILKQKFLGPKYIELETVLLHKAIKMASAIRDEDANGARTLKSLTGVLSDLLQHNPLLRAAGMGEDLEALGESGKTWTINIVEVDKKDDEKKDDNDDFPAPPAPVPGPLDRS